MTERPPALTAAIAEDWWVENGDALSEAIADCLRVAYWTDGNVSMVGSGLSWWLVREVVDLWLHDPVGAQIRDLLDTDTDEPIGILAGVSDFVQGTVQSLVEAGEFEVVIEDGWPRLRATAGWRDIWPAGDRLRAVRERMRHLAEMPYSEYLTSDEWKKRRERHLAWAKHHCQVCNAEKGRGVWLEVHHRSYERRGNELASDLVVLCVDCHRMFHELRRIGRGG